MPADSQARRGCQFSLRTFLIACLALGVGAGLLGRLCVRNRELFLVIVSLLSTVGPFLLAIGTILWIGYRRKPDRRWGLIAWGLALLVMPIVGIGMTFVVRRTAPPPPGSVLSPRQLQSLSTRRLIDQELPKRIDEPWVWNVLAARLNAGNLTQQELDDAIKQLIAHMKTTRPEGWDQPMHWQDDFVKAAVQRGQVSEPVLLDLCDAFYGPKPVIEPLPRVRDGGSGFGVDVRHGNTWGRHSGLPLQLLWEVQRVLLDGQPLEVRRNYQNADQWSGYHDGSLNAGEYELTVEVQCAYVDRDKLIGLNASDLPAERWPKASKRWKQTVSAPLKVYPADEPVVRLTTDPGLNPGKTGGIRIERLVVQADAKGKKTIILKLAFDEGLPVPISYDVAVALDGETVALGQAWVAQEENRWIGGPDQLQKQLDALDAAVSRADVILTPNPRHIEHLPEVSEIWGGKTILKGVLIERLDLETAQATEQP